jgi:ABC-type multidrug transport system fused ATPase/permease subunit
MTQVNLQSHSVSSRSSTPGLTPSLTLSPPLPSSPNVGKSTAQKGGKTPRNYKTTGLENNLSDLDISGPFCMQKVASAIENVAESIEDPEDAHSSTESRAALHVSRGSHRRRSSSRLNDPIHDIKDENPPNDRFHNSTFQDALREAKALMAGFRDTLGSNSLHYEPDSVMQRLHQQAAKLAHFECPSTRTVGFVGDSGVGKSSLLNSLLDKQGLARTVSGCPRLL